jgi:hypothetical protein
LLQITKAGNTPGFAFGAAERGQKQAGQNGNDGNHHEQFNQRKPSCLTQSIASAANVLLPEMLHLMM